MRSRNRVRGPRIATGVVLSMMFPALAGQGHALERTVDVAARENLTLTIYNQDLALVSESRRIALEAGENEVAIVGISPQLRPGTAVVRGAGDRILEQTFAFNVISPASILDAAVGQTVRLVRTNPQTGEETVEQAQLLSSGQGIVLKVGDRIEIDPPGRIVVDRIPPGLWQHPTLVVRLDSEKGTSEELGLLYLTGGLSWQAAYVAELDEAKERMALVGSVVLTNTSGIDFGDAMVRVVAGEVYQDQPIMARAEMAMQAAQAKAADSSEVSDRRLYKVGRMTLADRETKQVNLLAADAVSVRKEYRFEGIANAFGRGDIFGPVSATLVLEFVNDQASGLGQALPAGIVRVYQQDDGDEPVFAGEDRIDNTPEGERVELRIGAAFDVTARARRTAFERLGDDAYETAQEIVVRNTKDQAVEVKVIGEFPPGWRMLEESAPHTKESAERLVWSLTVPAQGEATLTYRIRIMQ